MEFGKNNTPFAEAEFLSRLVQTKTRMAGASLDLLIISDPANMNDLTGYDGWSFYVHQFIVVGLNLDQPIWIGRSMDVNGARLTTVLRDENIVGYPDDYVQSTSRHPMQFVVRVLRERGLAKGRIGVEADSFYFTGKSLDVLRAELAEAQIADAGVLWSVERSRQKGTHSAMSERRQPGSTVGNPHAAASNQDMASKEEGQRYVAAAERTERVTEMYPRTEGLAGDDEAERIDKVRVAPRCLIPDFDGAFLSRDWKDALWAELA